MKDGTLTLFVTGQTRHSTAACCCGGVVVMASVVWQGASARVPCLAAAPALSPADAPPPDKHISPHICASAPHLMYYKSANTWRCFSSFLCVC